MKITLVAILLLGICHISSGGWVNDWDKPVSFKCPDGEYIYRIKSTHDNGKEDRRFEFFCRPGFVSDECSFTKDYVNQYDETINWSCPEKGIVTGLYSVHDNGKEDRRWKIRCCKLSVKPGTNCETTQFLNELDQDLDYSIEHGEAIIGLYSEHYNKAEDRRLKVRTCSFTTCQAKKMTVLDRLRPTHTGTLIIGIVTEQGCSTATHAPNLGESREYTESTSFTTSKTKEFNFGTTLSVTVETSAEILGAGVSVTYGIEQSFGGAISSTKEETEEASLATGTSSSTVIEYEGPAAILIVGWKDEYTYNTNNINVEYDIECDNGLKYKERGTVSLTAKSYGKTHFTKRLARFKNAYQCNWTTENCVANVRGDKAHDVETIIDDFKRCFPNYIADIAK